jgi:hypothetical protein
MDSKYASHRCANASHKGLFFRTRKDSLAPILLKNTRKSHSPISTRRTLRSSAGAYCHLQGSAEGRRLVDALEGWPLALFFDLRTSGFETFRPTSQKEFFNGIRHERTLLACPETDLEKVHQTTSKDQVQEAVMPRAISVAGLPQLSVNGIKEFQKAPSAKPR